MTKRIDLARVCLLGALLTLSSSAAASTTFPNALQQKLGLKSLPYPPLGCQLCHQNDQGGLGTATKPFGRAVRKDGAMGGSVPSLISALIALEADGTDSDHDGVPDIAELKAGTDPNVPQTADGMPEAPVDEVPLPETGCSLSGARSPGSWLLLLGAVAALARRRRSAEQRRLAR